MQMAVSFPSSHPHIPSVIWGYLLTVVAAGDPSDGDMALFVCLLFCGDAVHTPQGPTRTQVVMQLLGGGGLAQGLGGWLC